MLEGRKSPGHHRVQTCLVLTVLGGGLSAYLLARAFTLLGPHGPAIPDLCPSWLGIDCGAALTDSRYWILGVPLAGWALVYFTILAGLLVLARFLNSSFAPDALLAGSVLALAGLAIGVAPTFGSLLGKTPFCSFCLVLHAINALLAFSLHRASGFPIRRQAHRLSAALVWFMRSRAEIPVTERWKLVAFGSVVLLAALAHQWVYVESAQRLSRSAKSPDRGEVIAAYQATPGVELPIGAEHPHLGPLDAPVRLVVFASFSCPSCRRFAATLSELERRFHGQLLVVFMHYPLSTQCNPRLSSDMQHGACELAWAAEAANQQGRFWAFHDAVFSAAVPPERVIDAVVLRTNLNRDRFDRDRDAASTKDRVAADIELGTRLRIPGTPAVFLDGRLVRSHAGETLAILIRHELEGRAAASRAEGRARQDSSLGWLPSSVKVGLRRDGRSRRPSRSVSRGARLLASYREGG